MRALARWLRRSDGQDLAEYCLITALVALIAGAILFRISGGMQNLWSAAGQTANSAAAVSGPAQTGGEATHGGH